MSAHDELFSLAAQDMPVSGDEVREAIDAYKRELLGVDLGCSENYLRKRFGEALWESPLTDHLDPEVWDGAISLLVDRLLTEAGVGW